jgi:hypothetical protein
VDARTFKAAVPQTARLPVVKLLARRAPRLLPLYYLGVAAGREFAPDRLQHDVIQGVSYTRVYDRYLRSWRRRRFSMLEIGVWQGASLRMWSNYFQRATVAGLDIDPGAARLASEFTVYTGSQDDPVLLDRVLADLPDLRLVVDDGSHINELTVASFRHLFPKLPSGALYLIEDMGVSYEDGPIPTAMEWHGMELNRPTVRHVRAELDALLLELIRDLDIGGSKRLASFVHFWPMCVVIGRA